MRSQGEDVVLNKNQGGTVKQRLSVLCHLQSNKEKIIPAQTPKQTSRLVPLSVRRANSEQMSSTQMTG